MNHTREWSGADNYRTEARKEKTRNRIKASLEKLQDEFDQIQGTNQTNIKEFTEAENALKELTYRTLKADKL
jgi:hypothetical protein